MPSGVIASTHSNEEWEPRDRDLKRYIHFDRAIPADRIRAKANDPALVAAHTFFPLLRFYEKWTKFRKGGVRKNKIRPLRYASRMDAAIYACYRVKLSKLYEAELVRRGIQDVPVAYRKILKPAGGNKCNIDIARDVFEFIRSVGSCHVTVVDIKSYFESIDHERIKSTWEALVGGALPPDHQAVFNAVTRYSVVDVEKVFSRLGMYNINTGGNRTQRRRRKIDEIKHCRHKQICSPSDFRNIIAGNGSGLPSLIQKNGFDFGIPQGTPISDLIANFYLIDFDEEVSEWASAQGGMYRRYSDDIIVVIPRADGTGPLDAKSYLQARIRAYGRHLRIQDQKVSVVSFEKVGPNLSFSHVVGHASRNGLEYLGFEYNGECVKIKNSTLSNAWRKVKRRAYGHAVRFVKRYRAKGRLWMIENYPISALETKILRDETFNQDDGYDTWTFVRYVRRCSSTFVGFNRIFSRQTRRYRRYTKVIISEAFSRALAVHS